MTPDDDQDTPGPDALDTAREQVERKASKKSGRDFSKEYARRKARLEEGRGDTPPPRRGRPPKEDAPPPPVLDPIDPAIVARALDGLSKLIAPRLGVSPLAPDEVKLGGEAFGPVLDHYAPKVFTALGPWTGAVAWTLGVVVPRIPEAIAARRQGSPSDETFPESSRAAPARTPKASGPVDVGPVVAS